MIESIGSVALRNINCNNSMLKSLYVIAFGFVMVSCDKNYTVQIELQDSLHLHSDKIVERFTAAHDTLAYTEAAKRFWVYKNVIREINLKRQSDRPEPTAFHLLNNENRPITFSPQEEERMTFQPSVIYFMERFRNLNRKASRSNRRLMPRSH